MGVGFVWRITNPPDNTAHASAAGAALATLPRKRNSRRLKTTKPQNTARHLLDIGNRYRPFDGGASCFQSTRCNCQSAGIFNSCHRFVPASCSFEAKLFDGGGTHFSTYRRRREGIWPVKEISSFEQIFTDWLQKVQTHADIVKVILAGAAVINIFMITMDWITHSDKLTENCHSALKFP